LNSSIFKKRYVSKIAGSAVVSLPMKDLKKVLVPVPSIEMQMDIARKLDSFQSLIMNLSEGLPAEIKARKQQYEYYRNKLLTFEERH
jgi:type I restriction enzyme S subunit